MIGDFVIRFRENALKRMDENFQEVARMAGALPSSPDSPERMRGDNIALGSMDRLPLWDKISLLARVLPTHTRNVRANSVCIKTLKDNPRDPSTRTDEAFLSQMERKAKEWGADAVGYTIVRQDYIFKNMGVLYKNAIVLTMKMDIVAINKAPSVVTLHNVVKTYADLGEAANKVASFLRQNGYGAQANPSWGGSAMYPILAEKAGLGWRGRHGMLISPDNGSCQRLAAVYTSIDNLPFAEENPHEWVREYCAKCGVCVKKCPAAAIYDVPPPLKNGEVKYIDSVKCSEFFGNNLGCSICIKECTFNKVGYSRLRKTINK